jgi:hypothetical protein
MIGGRLGRQRAKGGDQGIRRRLRGMRGERRLRTGRGERRGIIIFRVRRLRLETVERGMSGYHVPANSVSSWETSTSPSRNRPLVSICLASPDSRVPIDGSTLHRRTSHATFRVGLVHTLALHSHLRCCFDSLPASFCLIKRKSPIFSHTPLFLSPLSPSPTLTPTLGGYDASPAVIVHTATMAAYTLDSNSPSRGIPRILHQSRTCDSGQRNGGRYTRRSVYGPAPNLRW